MITNLQSFSRLKPERYNVLRQAAERALVGWPQEDEEEFGKTPKKDKSIIPTVLPAPKVASRTSPGTVPMKVD